MICTSRTSDWHGNAFTLSLIGYTFTGEIAVRNSDWLYRLFSHVKIKRIDLYKLALWNKILVLCVINFDIARSTTVKPLLGALRALYNISSDDGEELFADELLVYYEWKSRYKMEKEETKTGKKTQGLLWMVYCGVSSPSIVVVSENVFYTVGYCGIGRYRLSLVSLQIAGWLSAENFENSV